MLARPKTNSTAGAATVATMPDHDSDEALMLAYVAGDARAFERLYVRYRQPLFRYLLRHTRHRELADDLFQEAWSRLIDARQRYEVRARFQTFLYTIAHHVFIDHCRRSAARPAISATQTDGSQLDSEDPVDGDPAQVLRHDELQRRLRIALDVLPLEQRDAFLLHEEAGLSLEQIAAVTGVGRETVKSRLRYAVHKLRTALAPVHAESPR